MERVLRPIFAAGPVIQAAIHNCEDMFLAPGKRPQFRPSLSWQAGPIGPEDYQAIMTPIIGARGWRSISRHGFVDLVMNIDPILGGGSLRVHACVANHHDGVQHEAAFRFLRHIASATACPIPGSTIVHGATGAGKTTLMAGMIKANLDLGHRVLLIEDEPELKSLIPQGPTYVSYRPGEGEQITASILRRRPDLVVIGEIRTAELAVMALQLMDSGHGLLAGLHAGSRDHARLRLRHLSQREPQPDIIFHEVTRRP
ncbi:MAG TPA: hypothetical protein DHV49_05370 [Alphaproteobacteria bacterium]|nr:hypothetical protein [Alphaproteobacteria bacterium]|tara:strand:- start:1252 stop:2022 length:771 start_codon:yes stop_codon:yes gene_type:complete